MQLPCRNRMDELAYVPAKSGNGQFLKLQTVVFHEIEGWWSFGLGPGVRKNNDNNLAS